MDWSPLFADTVDAPHCAAPSARSSEERQLSASATKTHATNSFHVCDDKWMRYDILGQL